MACLVSTVNTTVFNRKTEMDFESRLRSGLGDSVPLKQGDVERQKNLRNHIALECRGVEEGLKIRKD